MVRVAAWWRFASHIIGKDAIFSSSSVPFSYYHYYIHILTRILAGLAV